MCTYHGKILDIVFLLYLLFFLPDLFIMLNLLFKTVRRSGIGTSNYIANAEVGIIQLT